MNESISDAARQFAAKVVMIANRRSVSPRDAAMAGRGKTTAAHRSSTASGAEGAKKSRRDSSPRKADPKSGHQPPGDDPFAAFSEWHEEIDTKIYGKL
ncbi:hypothetical protein [Brevundimonas diminuta]|jgi:hypothetical protein|uniref:hypothetical protein n=1 Tax=Brevundimonas diminuta TaxID=293 RepID=UPI0035D5BBF9